MLGYSDRGLVVELAQPCLYCMGLWHSHGPSWRIRYLLHKSSDISVHFISLCKPMEIVVSAPCVASVHPPSMQLPPREDWFSMLEPEWKKAVQMQIPYKI